MLLLLTLLPLGAHFLPESPRALLLPGVVVAVACVTALLRLPAVVRVTVTGFGALVVVGLSLWTTPTSVPMVVAIVPCTILAAGGSVLVAGVGLVAGLVTAAVTGPGASSAAMTGIGWALAAGWAMALLVMSSLIRSRLRRTSRVYETDETLNQRLREDRTALEMVVRRLTGADPAVVSGAGVSEDSLGLAITLPRNEILVGRLRGDILSTLTAGWFLRACATAGEIDPTALVRMLHTDLDEVVESDFGWVGIFAPGMGLLRYAGPNGQVQTVRCPRVMIGSGGPGAAWNGENDIDPLEDLFACEEAEARMWPPSRWLDMAAEGVFAGGLVAALMVPGLVASAVVLAGFLVVHDRVRRRLVWAHARGRAAETTVQDRIEVADDVHHRLSKLQSSLLPYQVSSGPFVATAHRLRGEVLDGSFADVFIDNIRRLRLVAGEVAGDGIATRFLGLGAQIHARAAALRGLTCEQARGRVARTIRDDAIALGHPLHVTLGIATLHDDGTCEGVGTLARMVHVDPPSARTVDHTQLDDGCRIYFTPSTSRPGPEDDAPRLEHAAAAGRVHELVVAGVWSYRQETLASLFSRVFDGEHGPRHGTIIELATAQSLEVDAATVLATGPRAA